MSTMSRRELVLDELRMVRGYTLDLIQNTDPADWFCQPQEGVTHVAWQVGHLAVAEYGLALKRIRGLRATDEQLIPSAFFQQFGKGSVPEPDPHENPHPDEILDVLHRVHDAVMHELTEWPESVLEEHVDQPHPMFTTKYGALQWCAQHEMLHAGQIGLLRRLTGQKPLR